jgi:single-strand DNA-binding protein
MNGFHIDGNVVADPIVRTVNAEWTVLEFRIANNDNRKKEGEEWKTEPMFFTLNYWSKNPAVWIQKIVKGAYCACAGKMSQDNWDDKTTGGKRSKIVYTIENLPTFRAPSAYAANKPEESPPEGKTPDPNDIPF